MFGRNCSMKTSMRPLNSSILSREIATTLVAFYQTEERFQIVNFTGGWRQKMYRNFFSKMHNEDLHTFEFGVRRIEDSRRDNVWILRLDIQVNSSKQHFKSDSAFSHFVNGAMRWVRNGAINIVIFQNTWTTTALYLSLHSGNLHEATHRPSPLPFIVAMKAFGHPEFNEMKFVRVSSTRKPNRTIGRVSAI